MEYGIEYSDFRKIPSVEKMLQYSELEKLLSAYKRDFIVRCIQDVLKEIRKRVSSGEDVDFSQTGIAARITQKVEQLLKPSLRRVINATGIILHTGLGRAILSRAAREALLEAAGNYCNLELDLASGQRGSRQHHLQQLICTLTGAEACLVVNNNAAAFMLALNTLAYHREVVVARGELVEIGGSFRMPEIMKRSECSMVEVGTTNRVTVEDYRRAVTDDTALFVKVHTSNYRIVGYTTEASLTELVSVGSNIDIPVMYDLGSGSVIPLTQFGLTSEPLITAAVKAGTDVVTFSADKMPGGPQAGIILGKKSSIDRIKKNPMARAVRVCKLTLAALEAVLREYLVDRDVQSVNPTLRLISMPLEVIAKRAEKLAATLEKAVGDRITLKIVDGSSMIGGGSFATEELPTKLVSIIPKDISVDELAAQLRQSTPPVIGRIAHDKLILDLRTVTDEQVPEIVSVFETAAWKRL